MEIGESLAQAWQFVMWQELCLSLLKYFQRSLLRKFLQRLLMHTIVIPTRASRHSKSLVRLHKNNNILPTQWLENILGDMKIRRMVLFNTAVNLSFYWAANFSIVYWSNPINIFSSVSRLIALQMCCVENSKQNIMTRNVPGMTSRWALLRAWCYFHVYELYNSLHCS